MRQDAQKQSRKFCRSKEGKNSETHPEKPEKGETGCVLGAGENGSGWERVKPDEKTRKARRKSRDGLVSAAASGAAPQWGAPSTDRGGSRDRRGRVPPARTRPSARGFGVDVGGRTRERKRAGVARFLSQVLERAVLVWYCGKFPCVFYDLRVSCFRNSLGEQPAYF